MLKVSDGFVAFQNGIYLDEDGKSRSAILMLTSLDGPAWEPAGREPILKPSRGWMKSHIYALDVARDRQNNRWFLYFNARNDWHWTKGKAAIGLLVGTERS